MERLTVLAILNAAAGAGTGGTAQSGGGGSAGSASGASEEAGGVAAEGESQTLEPSAGGRITAADHIPSADEHREIFNQELAKLSAETNGAIGEDNFDTFEFFARAESNDRGTVKAVEVGSFAETRGAGSVELLGGTTPGSGQSRLFRSSSVGGTFKFDGVGTRTLTGRELVRFTILHEYQHQVTPGISERQANIKAWRMFK